MRNGYNKYLAIKASSIRIGLDTPEKSRFDDKGNVIRNFRAELAEYERNEQSFVLPQVDLGYFDGHRKFSEWEEKQKDNNFVPDVKRIKVVELHSNKKTEIKPIQMFQIAVNFLISKIFKDKNEYRLNKGWSARFYIVPPKTKIVS